MSNQEIKSKRAQKSYTTSRYEKRAFTFLKKSTAWYEETSILSSLIDNQLILFNNSDNLINFFFLQHFFESFESTLSKFSLITTTKINRLVVFFIIRCTKIFYLLSRACALNVKMSIITTKYDKHSSMNVFTRENKNIWFDDFKLYFEREKL